MRMLAKQQMLRWQYRRILLAIFYFEVDRYLE
jgi:hypothetical protein